VDCNSFESSLDNTEGFGLALNPVGVGLVFDPVGVEED